MICPHCGYEKNTEDALCCNLCYVVFHKKNKQEIPATVDTISAKGVTSFDNLPDELKTILLKEKDDVFRKSDNLIIEPKKMMIIGIVAAFILLLIGGMAVLLPSMKTMLTKGQG